MSEEQNSEEEHHAADKRGLQLAEADVAAPLVGAEDAGDPARDAHVINMIQQQLRNMQLQEQQPKSFQFWNTQPVPKLGRCFFKIFIHFCYSLLGELVTENTYINPPVPVDQVQQTPYRLPSGYRWAEVDLKNADELKELYTLLSLNYVEDDDNMFRFDYSAEFLLW